MHAVLRLVRALPAILLAGPILLIAAIVLALADLVHVLRPRKKLAQDTMPDTTAATVVIPNWNGRDLLENYLPSVVKALSRNPRNEVLVVDNGSSDGSAEFLRKNFPNVRVLALKENLGFGGGSNAGFAAAANDIVVLLNSDMRVDEGFLQPLLDGFTDASVFAVSCQIFFTDPNKLREETGLTQGWWADGTLRVSHRNDPQVKSAYPCFYGGGGSCAFDRRKFQELGGFDHLLAPFYLEDTDLGFMAWKRGWKVMYEPRSIVFHEHRGTIGKKFTRAQIDAVLAKNYLLFIWKNIHEWRRLAEHLAYTELRAIFDTGIFRGVLKAASQLPEAFSSRLRARALAAVSDTEAFARPNGGAFRDRFTKLPAAPERLNVLFLSPYPICPPVHGGAVFMYQTIRELVKHVNLHLIILLDHEREMAPHDELKEICGSVEFIIRMQGQPKQLGSIRPHAVREFDNADLRWLINRQILLHEIDVFQIEYTNMGQYSGGYKQIPSILFEHDVYFQSIGRNLETMRGALRKVSATFEYLRAIRYELQMLPRQDRIQVCSVENGAYLSQFLPAVKDKIDYGLRAGIDTSRYEFRLDGRTPDTLLFLGSFRHVPNAEALDWFVQHAFPRVLEMRPSTRLIVIGSDPPPRHSLPDLPNIELIGYVDDILRPLAENSVFICPILSGSGVRVKLLEAFSAGIPVVSTKIGAEGLARTDGEFCALADDPVEFAKRCVELLEDRERANAMAVRARKEVEENWDMAAITRKLEKSYRRAVQEMRARAS